MSISRLIGLVVLTMIVAGILKLLILIPFEWIGFAIGLYIVLAVLQIVWIFIVVVIKGIYDQWQSRN